MLSEENNPAGFSFISLSGSLSYTTSQGAFGAGQSAQLSALLGQLCVPSVWPGKDPQSPLVTELPLGLYDYTFKRWEQTTSF